MGLASNHERLNRFAQKIERVVHSEQKREPGDDKLSFMEMIGVLHSIAHDLEHELWAVVEREKEQEGEEEL